MNKETVTFGGTEIKNPEFHFYKGPIFLEDVNIETY